MPAPAPIVRRTLFTGELMAIAHVAARPTSTAIANNSGGAIAQIFAVHHPHRLRTLTLTNCDTHDNWPPAATLPMIEPRAGVRCSRRTGS